MATNKTSTPLYPCGRCGKRSKAAEMIYSRFTGARYCRGYTACAKRQAKLKKKGST